MILRLIHLLSSSDSRLFAYDAGYRSPIRVELINAHRREFYHVVLPLVRVSPGEREVLDPAIASDGAGRELLEQIAKLHLQAKLPDSHYPGYIGEEGRPAGAANQ
jgi:hypothetical protein